MLLNLSDVFETEGCKLSEEIDVAGMVIEDFGVLHEISEGRILLGITHYEEGRALIHADGRIKVKLSCDRCLSEVIDEIDISFDEEAYAPDMIPEDSDQDDFSYMEEYNLNVDSLLKCEILMQWPMKVLCKPDCRGICMKCGQNLNLGTCSCDTFVPDPRMAAFSNIFDAIKEV
ncbi:MAG: DUF177 domain-containing protein [Lachnospiraceae bacterium]|nr:DUF177 domain-containing protein [Candidatus Merdinaster equi]